MACCAQPNSLLSELKDLVNQIGDNGCCEDPCPPCCRPLNVAPPLTPCTFPYAQVIMTCPPPIMPPTRPEPVKPLQLPCPPSCCPPPLTPEEEERSRYANFYNNYNVNYHDEQRYNPCCPPCPPQQKPEKMCEDYTKRDDCCPAPGCPTGFKPCKMRLCPPPCCDPNGVWWAQVQPCPPKPKKKNAKYEPGPCMRPCCKHWKPKEGPCLYDDPCKADCFNHPPGMKPSGRYP